MVESSHKDDYISLTRAVISTGKLRYHLRCSPLPAAKRETVLSNLERILPLNIYEQVSDGKGDWMVKEECSVGIQP